MQTIKMGTLVTNNPLVRDNHRGQRIAFYDTDYLGVLIAVRDKIHLGYGLLSHPLSGSIKPGQTPYKTVVISAHKGDLDNDGLFLMEESIQTCLKLAAESTRKNWSPEILADFQLVDYSLVFFE